MPGSYAEGDIGDAYAAEVVALNALQDASNTNINANDVLNCDVAYNGESILVIIVIRMFAVVSIDPYGHRNIVHAHIGYVDVPYIPSTSWSGLDSDSMQ